MGNLDSIVDNCYSIFSFHGECQIVDEVTVDHLRQVGETVPVSHGGDSSDSEALD